MASFDNREKGFEAKFKRDKEIEFKVMARRNKLLGLWAADLMGKSGDDADVYAKEVVIADFDEPGEEDVYRKVMADFEAKGTEMTEPRLRKEMARLMGVARTEIEQAGSS